MQMEEFNKLDMNNEKIAVILPVYKNDKAEYLKLAIDSILAQTYDNMVLYIGVDGPVNDVLLHMLSQYGMIENVFVQYYKENRGLAIVLNDLIKLCEERHIEFIARMDADDISMPDRLEKQMAFMMTHPDVDVVGGAIEEIDEWGILKNKRIVYPSTPNDCKDFFARRNPVAHPAVLFRTRFFEKAGCYYRPEYRQNQDTMLWYDGLMKGCQIANITDVVLHFRMTESLFKKRRGGYAFAKKQLNDRLMINKVMEYGLAADLFAYAMFILMLLPPSFRKIAYKIFR